MMDGPPFTRHRARAHLLSMLRFIARRDEVGRGREQTDVRFRSNADWLQCLKECERALQLLVVEQSTPIQALIRRITGGRPLERRFSLLGVKARCVGCEIFPLRMEWPNPGPGALYACPVALR